MKNTSCVSVALYYSTKIKFINIVDLHYFRYIHTQKKQILKILKILLFIKIRLMDVG